MPVKDDLLVLLIITKFMVDMKDWSWIGPIQNMWFSLQQPMNNYD
jgi:hypothetical protein